VRVLIAPDLVVSQGQLMPAAAVAAELAAGWRAARPLDEIVTHPLGTGGPGLVEVVVASRGGDTEVIIGRGPCGEPVPLTWRDDDVVAYVDASALLGRLDGEDAAELALHGSSAGVGDLIASAVGGGAARVVVGAGAVGTHDAGIGALRALAGARSTDPLRDVVPSARERLRGVEVLVAAATDRPLVGLSGAGAALAGRPGVDAALAQRLEQRLAPQIAEIEAATERPVSLLAATPGARERRGSRRPYTGAGGGLAFALDAVGARVLDGARVLAAETGLGGHVAAADVVLTACTTLDGTALEIGVPAAVGRAAIDQMVPVVVVAAQVHVGRRELAGTGIEAAYPVSDPLSPGSQRPGAGPGGSLLSQRASRVARTWSR